jgi:hypothetical protein
MARNLTARLSSEFQVGLARESRFPYEDTEVFTSLTARGVYLLASFLLPSLLLFPALTSTSAATMV